MENIDKTEILNQFKVLRNDNTLRQVQRKLKQKQVQDFKNQIEEKIIYIACGIIVFALSIMVYNKL